RSEKNSPARTAKDTRSTATTEPKRFVIARTSRSAPRVPGGPLGISGAEALHPGLDLLFPPRAPLARLLPHHTPVEPDRAVDHLRVERRIHLLGERRRGEGGNLVRELGVPRVVFRRHQLVDDLLGDLDLVRRAALDDLEVEREGDRSLLRVHESERGALVRPELP